MDGMNSRLVMALLLIALIVLPAVYVLSAAPVIWLANHDYVPMSVLHIYDPAGEIPVVRKFILWQLDQMP
jgi:hypothetical protein